MLELPKKSPSSLKIDYDLNNLLTARGEIDRVEISLSDKGGTASWENGLIKVTEKNSSFNPRIYSSRKDGSDRSQPNKQVDSSEYFPLATVTVTNNQDLDKPLVDNSGIALISQIKVSLEGENQTTEFAPLDLQRIGIDIKDFLTGFSDADKVEIGGSLIGYQNLTIADSQKEASPFYFGYVGAVEGSPRKITKDELLVGKENRADLKDGETKTYTLYGRIFSTEKAPVDIISITEDRGTEGDFKTSDDTLIFNGTAEVKSKVEVFLDGKGIGTTQTDDKGNWSYDYQKTKLADGKYDLSAKYTDSRNGVISAKQELVIEPDTTYDIDLDFTDKSFNPNFNPSNDPKFEARMAKIPVLQAQIRDAAEYWEDIILDDIPDVKKSNGTLIDDLEITFKIEDLKNKGKLDGKGKTLAVANTFELRDPLTGQQSTTTDYIPYQAVITIDSVDIDNFIDDNGNGTTYGLQTLKHEIAHAIGFNSATFENRGSVTTIVENGTKYYGFNGTNALKAYKSKKGKQDHKSVPLENKSNPAHWNEWVFPDKTELQTIPDARLFGFPDDELMSSTTPNNQNAVLSKVTLGAFQDLGFDVNPNAGSNLEVYSSSNIPLLHSSPLFAINY